MPVSRSRARDPLRANAVVRPGPKGRRLVITELSQSYFTGTYKHRILLGIPSMGQVRIEWHNAVNGLVVPVNWSNSIQTPIGFMVDDAQNVIVKHALDHKF